jgi:epoxyqueuosine reductase
MKKVLLHVCCANCAIYPNELLREEGYEVTGFFFNPNIHPYQEYAKRRDTVVQYSEKTGLRMMYRDEYLLETFLRNVAHRETERCGYCYSLRLETAAREAKAGCFDAFSTSLLYSIYQNHSLIRETGERLAAEIGIPFLYEDFRPGWRKGIEVSKALGLYRQKYCGCIYSEKERFLKKA